MTVGGGYRFVVHKPTFSILMLWYTFFSVKIQCRFQRNSRTLASALPSNRIAAGVLLLPFDTRPPLRWIENRSKKRLGPTPKKGSKTTLSWHRSFVFLSSPRSFNTMESKCNLKAKLFG